MFSFKTAIEEEKLKLPNCVNITPETFPHLEFCSDAPKTQDIIKNGHEIYHLTNINLFPQSALNRTETGQGRTEHGRMRTGQAAVLGYSPSDILVDRTTNSALPICPTSQCTFVGPNFLRCKKKF